MVSLRPFISMPYSLLVIVPSAPTTIGITVTFMFRSFFQFSKKVLVRIALFAFLQVYPVVSLDYSAIIIILLIL